MLEQLNDTLNQISGDTDENIGWPEILDLLKMDRCSFKDDKEEALGLEFFQDLVEQNGKRWLQDNRYQAMNTWEEQLDKHRVEQTRERKDRKRKRIDKRVDIFISTL